MISFYRLIILSNIFCQFISQNIIIFKKQTFDIVNNCLLFQNQSTPSENTNFDSTSNICKQCQNGFYLDNGNCIYIPNCTNPIVNQIEDIISCEEGIYLGYYKQSFFQCPESCISCFKKDQEIHCKDCQIGYAHFIDGSCQSPPDNCSQASTILVKIPLNNQTIPDQEQSYEQQQDQQQNEYQEVELIKCDVCDTGFITQINDFQTPQDFYNQCVDCSQIIDNCISCSLVLDQKYICNSCDEGYFLKQDQNQQSVCQQCSNNCQYCTFGQVEYNVPFTISNSQVGVEEREICLKCPKGYGFHYDGKTCVKCNQCDQCYYLVNRQFIYTLGTNFMALTDDDITSLKIQIELTCFYQTCSDGCIDQFNSNNFKKKYISIFGNLLCQFSFERQRNAKTFTTFLAGQIDFFILSTL